MAGLLISNIFGHREGTWYKYKRKQWSGHAALFINFEYQKVCLLANWFNNQLLKHSNALVV